MVRTLYRIYLYTVWILLLVLAAVATAVFLGTLLNTTPLRGQFGQQPSRQSLTQQGAFLVIAWLIAATLGGLHYWLIRRDIRDDPGAGSGPVRSLYLNYFEANAMLVAVPATAVALASLSSYQSGGEAALFASGVVAYGFFALLELERRRTIAAPGAAIVLQRLHFYGVHLILLFIATRFWLDALKQSLTAVLIQVGQLANPCTSDTHLNGSCYIGYSPPAPHLVWLWVSALAASLPIVLYAYLTRGDLHSNLRQVLHFVCYGYGIVWVLVAIDQLATLLLLAARGHSISALDVITQHDFISPAFFGVVVVALYALWLGRDALLGPMGVHTLGLSVLAVTAGILAVPFWVGCGKLLYDVVERYVASGVTITTEEWASSAALLITGIGYVPLAIRLRQRSRLDARATPRRGLVLALLALGTLTTAVGLAVTLYAVLTASIGAPLSNWQETARSGGVALVIGLVLAGIYLQRALAEGIFRRHRPVRAEAESEAARTQPAMRVPAGAADTASNVTAQSPAPERDMLVEAVLDDLLTGKLTRDEAVAHIRELIGAGHE